MSEGLIDGDNVMFTLNTVGLIVIGLLVVGGCANRSAAPAQSHVAQGGKRDAARSDGYQARFILGGGVEVHQKRDADGRLIEERRLEEGVLRYHRTFFDDGTEHVRTKYSDGIVSRRTWYPAPAEVVGGTYKQGQPREIEEFREGQLHIQRRFGQNGSYVERSFEGDKLRRSDSYTASGRLTSRQEYHEEQTSAISHFYDDGTIKSNSRWNNGGRDPVTTYYDREGKVTTAEQVQHYEATLRFLDPAVAVSSHGLSVSVSPVKQNFTIGSAVDLKVTITCVAREGVSLLGKAARPDDEGGATPQHVPWQLEVSARQKTGFGVSTIREFIPPTEQSQPDRIDLDFEEHLSKRVAIHPWGPAYGVMPTKALPGFLALRVSLMVPLADGEVMAHAKSNEVHIVVTDDAE